MAGTDWDAHFANLAPAQSSGASPSAGGSDWEGHFNSIAPQQAQPAAPAQNTSWTRLPEMAGSEIVGAVGNFLGLPGDLDLALTAGANALTGANVSTAVPGGLVPRFPSSGDIQAVTNKLGLTNNPSLTPSGPLEEYGSAAIGGLASGVLAAAFGGGSLLSNLAVGLAGSEAGEGAKQMFPNSKWAPVVAGVAAGLGVGGISSKVENWINASQAAKKLESSQAQLEAARDSQFYGGEEARVKTGAIKDASKATLEAKQDLINGVVAKASNDATQTFDQHATQLGDSTTLQQAGQSLQAEARNWISSVLPTKLAAAWAPVDAAVPKDMQLELPQFHQALKDINSSAGALEPVAALLKPSMPARIAGALAPKEGLEDLISDSPAGPQQFSWQDTRKLRSTLGDALHNPQVIKDVGAENLDRLYASLTSDLGSAAERAGAGDAFNVANLESRRLYQIGEGPMSRVVAGARKSEADPAPESVAGSLLSGGKKGASDLQVLRDEIPNGVSELAAAHLRQGPEAWGKLSPEAQAALVPAADQSADLNSSLQTKLQAEQNAKAELLAAKRDHAETSSAADEDLKTGNFSRTEQVRLAQKAVAEAKAGIPPQPSPVVNLAHKLGNATGAAFGYEFAPTVLSHLGIAQNPLALAGVSAAGLAIPALGRSFKSVLKNPASASPAIVGGLGGANALSLNQ